jgi:hypothetical protein
MPALFSNSASAPLASSISSSATSITVGTGQGALFPAVPAGSYFWATLTDSSGNLEIVKVTARSADIMTVVRGQDGTSGRAYAAADKFELRITAAGLSNFAQLDGAQTFTGVKTFSAGLVGNVTGNLTGNVTGNLTGNVTGNVTGNLTGSVTGNASSASTTPVLATASFTLQESGGKLVFLYGATAIASVDSAGNFTALNNVTAYGAP